MNNNDGWWSLDCWRSLEGSQDSEPDEIVFTDADENDHDLWMRAYNLLGSRQFKLIQLWKKLDVTPPDGTWTMICELALRDPQPLWPPSEPANV
jgi:hypothetical protein